MTNIDKIKAQLNEKQTFTDVLEMMGYNSEDAKKVGIIAEQIYEFINTEMNTETNRLQLTEVVFALHLIVMQQVANYREDSGDEAANKFFMKQLEFMQRFHNHMRIAK